MKGRALALIHTDHASVTVGQDDASKRTEKGFSPGGTDRLNHHPEESHDDVHHVLGHLTSAEICTARIWRPRSTKSGTGTGSFVSAVVSRVGGPARPGVVPRKSRSAKAAR